MHKSMFSQPRSAVVRQCLNVSQAQLCKLHRSKRVRRCRAEEKDGSHVLASSAVKDLLENDPEAYNRIERIKKAAQHVAELQAQRAEMDKAERDGNYAKAWQAQDIEQDQAQRASVRGANADVLAAADDFERAQADLNTALGERDKWSGVVNEEAEKIESAKAAIVGGLGALLGSLPLLVGSRQSFLANLVTIGATAMTGTLFAVTYRYAIRQDLGNTQLKSGVVGAFGLARGLALAEGIIRDREISMESIALAALSCGQSLIVLGFATLSVELAFQRQFVKPFGGASHR